MQRIGSLGDLALVLVTIFADHPVPSRCRHEAWRRMERAVFQLHERVAALPSRPGAADLHAVAVSTGRCQRLVAALDRDDPLVVEAVLCLTELVQRLERAARCSSPVS